MLSTLSNLTLATSVLPQPGGPYSSTPAGVLTPSAANRSGKRTVRDGRNGKDKKKSIVNDKMRGKAKKRKKKKIKKKQNKKKKN